MAQYERKEREEADFSIGALFWKNVAGSLFEYGTEDETPPGEVQLSEETERKFLLLSWWLNHRGWRQLGQRIRQVTEEGLEKYVISPEIDHPLTVL